MAAWLAYALAVSLLLGGAALGVERGLRSRRLPTRWAWAVAMLGSALLPLVRRPPEGTPGRGWPAAGIPGASAAATRLPPGPVESSAPVLSTLDAALLAGWALGTVAVLLFLAVAAARLHRRSREWRGDLVAGERVLVSREVGPAVVGFLVPEIVVPAWALGEPSDARRLLVLHERSHRTARDPLLVLGGLLVTAALPWNLPLWWQLRRLRGAIELDCDARVVARGAGTQPYGLLLLEVARRVPGSGTLATAFAASRSLLERRIAALASPPRPLGSRSRLVLLGGVVAAGVAAAIPTPGAPGPLEVVRAALRAGEAAPPPRPRSGDVARPRLLNRHEAPRILARVYPAALREAGVGGVTVLWAFIDADGRVRSVTVAESSAYPELDEAARRAMRALRFEPAHRGRAPVAAWIQHPITFVPRPEEPRAGNRLAIWTAPAAGSGSIARLR